jgi:hypothetical protein
MEEENQSINSPMSHVLKKECHPELGSGSGFHDSRFNGFIGYHEEILKRVQNDRFEAFSQPLLIT